MSDNRIRLTEGDEVTYTITVKRAGSAEDVSGTDENGILFYAHEEGVAFGTNQVNGVVCAFVSDGTDGQVTMVFAAAHTTIETNRDLKGVWAIKLLTSTKPEWTRQEPFEIVRNPFVAEG